MLVTINRKTRKDTDLYTIVRTIQAGWAKDIFSVGDEIDIILKNNEHVVMTVAGFNLYEQNEVTFISRDCLQTKMCMNPKASAKGGWKKSALRERLNSEILDLLPDELVYMIKPKKTIQHLAGDRIVCRDKLWLPTSREIQGRHFDVTTVTYSDHTCDDGEKQIPLFADKGNRLKKHGGDSCSWWTCSPSFADYEHFNTVTDKAASHAESADRTLGVPLCFCIR